MQRFHPPFYPLLYPYPPSLAPPPWIFSSSFIPFPAILCVHVGEAWPAINSRGHRRNYGEKRDEEEEEERTSKGWLYYPEGNFVPPRDCWVIVVRSVWPMLHLLTRIIVKEEKKKKMATERELESMFRWSFRFSSLERRKNKLPLFADSLFFLFVKGEWRKNGCGFWESRDFLQSYLENISRLTWK